MKMSAARIYFTQDFRKLNDRNTLGYLLKLYKLEK